MPLGKATESPLAQFVILCVSIFGIIYYGNSFINENRLDASNLTASGKVLAKQKGYRSNTVYYDYLCETQTCLSGQQSVSIAYYRKLKINDEVTVTYVERNSDNLSRIEKRPAVYFYSLAMTFFMFGLLIYYGRRLKKP